MATNELKTRDAIGMSRKGGRQGDVADEEELGRARPSRDVMLSPKSGPLEELLHPQSTFLPLPDWGANTCDDEGARDRVLVRRTSSRDRGVEEGPHLNGVAASKSGDCGDGLAALCVRKRGC